MLFACLGPHDAALAECPSVRAQCTPMGGAWGHTGEATLAGAQAPLVTLTTMILPVHVQHSFARHQILSSFAQCSGP